MGVNTNLFLHESDRIALQALKAIPGFTQLLKSFMKVWSEKQWRIINMSTNLRLSENQMSKYYNMLPPICEKLGINVPELYLELNVNPNAYTYGDAEPFIVITSGLLETMPEELIPIVLAHECGHIACHHTLYTTMGTILLNGANLLGLNELVSLPIQVAFHYWMRCSEFSADRAALVCDGNPDNLIRTCLCLAGYDKDIESEANLEAFLEQAIEYKKMVQDSKWNKTLEFLMLSDKDHPYNAVRAYEAREWAESENFAKLKKYLELDKGERAKDLPFTEASRYYVGKNYLDVELDFQIMGFDTIELVRITEKNAVLKDGQVTNVTKDDNLEFSIGEWYTSDRKIIISYYHPLTEVEIIAMHPDEVRMPDSSKKYIGRDYREVVEELKGAGFGEIITEAKDVKKSLFTKDNSVGEIIIGGENQFEKGTWYNRDVIVKIIYYVCG